MFQTSKKIEESLTKSNSLRTILSYSMLVPNSKISNQNHCIETFSNSRNKVNKKVSSNAAAWCNDFSSNPPSQEHKEEMQTPVLQRRIIPLLYYFFFGLIHECAHLAAFHYYSSYSDHRSNNQDYSIFHKSHITSFFPHNDDTSMHLAPSTLMKMMLGRHVTLPHNPDIDSGLIRHVGWLASLCVAFICHFMIIRYVHYTTINPSSSLSHGASIHDTQNPSPPSKNSPKILSFHHRAILSAAYITALEALFTDLFQIVPHAHESTTTTTITYFCGNFGIIVLNHKWIHSESEKNSCQSVFTVLKEMIRVTMIRGAQSGGVVTFYPRNSSSSSSSKKKNTMLDFVGIRSRVVNRKRTDLSDGIIDKLRKDVFDGMFGFSKIKGGNAKSDDYMVRMFAGHTRFATSSIANFDGTHPHQWTKRSTRRVYDFSTGELHQIGVENFISHNGDFDFYDLNGTTYELETCQHWIESVLGCPMPSRADSACMAGFVDLMRTQGCFALSIRYAITLGSKMTKMFKKNTNNQDLPQFSVYERLATVFEEALDHMIQIQGDKRLKPGLHEISNSKTERRELSSRVLPLIKANKDLILPLKPFIFPLHLRNYNLDNDDVEDVGSHYLNNFIKATINAFFDNDLFQTTKEFLSNAHGSFGICFTSSLDAHRQICMASRGQTISIAFYPKKGIICYGSELSAVKAALNVNTPDGDIVVQGHNTSRAFRLDLDDIGGEICLLDWSKDALSSDETSIVSPLNRDLKVCKVMNDTVSVLLYKQNKPGIQKNVSLYQRAIILEGNRFIHPLKKESNDIVASDIKSIPRVCKAIQEDWHNASGKFSINRLSALTLARCLMQRLEAIDKGDITPQTNSVDILLTGCEISLWVAEQFASDLKKCFPRLGVMAVSSNKLLSVFGQEQSIPCIGFPLSKSSHVLTDAIVIIVSHSGGTFAPLQCSNLLQSTTKNIFAITGEWDTQVGKQLRAMFSDEDSLWNSRIFTTDVGLATAEPCSLSVAAMHQLLTNIFEYICMVIINNPRYRRVTASKITHHDLSILDRCNMDNVKALERIVGVDCDGNVLSNETSTPEKELRAMGDVWSEHVLECAKAYIMSFIYIVATVTSGYPLINGIASAIGYSSPWLAYLLRFLDSLIYFWLPQINIIILRLLQRRNLRHRMVGRTVVIGDCPWVAQCAEAFLSKLFACSYSIASLNVYSANAADHLVHRHTHRVVRGTLLVCGRPDGRLMALTSLESSVLLSVNQASSIQSWGGRCESITIGHNPFHNNLCYRNIFLPRSRPLFLCEQIMDMSASISKSISGSYIGMSHSQKNKSVRGLVLNKIKEEEEYIGMSRSQKSLSVSFKNRKGDNSLLSEDMMDLSRGGRHHSSRPMKVSDILVDMKSEHADVMLLHKIFRECDEDKDGKLNFDEFKNAYDGIDSSLSKDEITNLFEEVNIDNTGLIGFDEFLKLSMVPKVKLHAMRHSGLKDNIGLKTIKPMTSRGLFFEEDMYVKNMPGVSKMAMVKSQLLSMQLYEARIASLQRFVSMTVLFHQIGSRVQSFFSRISFGYWSYRMDRTHSIMRVASTASPVSGAYVRKQAEALRLITTLDRAVHVIASAWFRYRSQKVKNLMESDLVQRKLSLGR